MSLEYTIDIQLTELGFPGIFEATETSGKETTENIASFNACISPGIEAINPPTPSPPPRHTETPEVGQRVGEGEAVHDSGGERDKIGIGSGAENTERGTCYISTRNEEEENGLEMENTDDSGVSEREEEFEEEDEEDEEDDELPPGMESDGSSEYHCGVCDHVLRSDFQLREHMNLHTGERPYCCDECGKRFCQLVNYRSHLRTHAQPKPLPADCCRICLKSFDTENALKAHLSSSHLESEFYECDVCKQIFTSRSKCEEHMEWHKTTMGSHVCPTCGRHFLRSRSLNRHRQKTCHKRSYLCCDCPLVFQSKNALLKHSFTHLGLLPYTCVQCQRHFRLARHYNKHKCDPDRIHCVACLGVFTSQQDFQRHKKDTGCWGHQGSKGDEIRCMECGESFNSAEELKKHAGAHQRVLTCFVCGKGFRSSLLLMSHMGGHASLRPCLCQKCGLGFPHQQDYESHLKNCGNIVLPMMAPKKPKKKTQAPASVSHSKPVLFIPLPVYKPAPKVPIPVYRPAHRVPIPVHKRTRKVPVPVYKPAPEVPIPVHEPAPKVPIPVHDPAPKVPFPVYKPATRIESGGAPVAAPVSVPTGVLNSVLAPVHDGDGVWKLSLDRNPPPGVKLVVFIPANSRLASGLSCPSSSPETPAAVVCPPQPSVMVLPPAPRPRLELESFMPMVSPPPGGYQHSDVPLDLVKKAAGNDILPLDLSVSATPKSTLPGPLVSNPTPSIKSESKDLGFSEEPIGSVYGSVQIKRETHSPRLDSGEQNMETSTKAMEGTLKKETVMEVDSKNGINLTLTQAVGNMMDLKLENEDRKIGSERTERVPITQFTPSISPSPPPSHNLTTQHTTSSPPPTHKPTIQLTSSTSPSPPPSHNLTTQHTSSSPPPSHKPTTHLTFSTSPSPPLSPLSKRIRLVEKP